jgi:rSAM/selenodomain-associated transferase 1
MVSEKIIIFCRYPESGKVKKRLIPGINPDRATLIHKEMAEFTLETVQLFRKERGVALEISFTGGQLESMRGWLGDLPQYSLQAKGDLGKRMSSAFSSAFQQQDQRVVIIGTDCPEITPAILESAFAGLIEHNVVIGPAYDGGYYLIGLKQEIPLIFKQVSWGSKYVFSQTIEHCTQYQLKVKILPKLHDIDRPEDLPLWNKIKQKSNFSPSLYPPIMRKKILKKH